MKSPKTIVRVICACIIALSCSSVSIAQDRLVPTPSVFAEGQQHLRYHTYLAKTLLKDYFERDFAVVCMPSFFGEWAIYYSDKKKQMVANYSRKNIYMAKKYGKRHIIKLPYHPKIDTYCMDIEPEQKLVFDSLFYYAICSAREYRYSAGLDGESFSFVSCFWSAQCWSPRKGYSKELVDIVEKLSDIIRKSDKEALADILTEAKALTEKFKSLNKRDLD